MDEQEKKVLTAAASWYRYILRAGEQLSPEEKELFNAVFEMKNRVKSSVVLNKDKQDTPYRPYEEEDRPTTPAPLNTQRILIEETKKSGK